MTHLVTALGARAQLIGFGLGHAAIVWHVGQVIAEHAPHLPVKETALIAVSTRASLAYAQMSLVDVHVSTISYKRR
jgi:hypothetical protein